MGLFDKVTEGISGALEGLGRTAGTILEGLAPIAGQALGARVAEKLGPRGAMPGTIAQPNAAALLNAQRQQQIQFGGPSAQLASVFNPATAGGGLMAQNPFGSGPFLPQVQSANFLGPVVRQLPGLLGGLAAGEAVESFLSPRAVSARMPGGIAVNSLFRQTPTGRLSPARVAFMEDGQGGGAFFVNAGVPKSWSKVTLRKRRTCRPR